MKIAIVTSQVPFVRGGAEVLAENLAGALRAQDHDAEIVALPSAWHPPPRLLDAVTAARLTRVPNTDMIIALKFPSYYVQHPRKVLWLTHQHRPAHDLWATRWGGLPDTVEGRATRDAVVQADRAWLPEASARFAISPGVAERLRQSTGLDAAVVAPPPGSRAAEPGPYGDYVLFHGRITALKRQGLAIAAMRHVRSGLRLVIAGAAATPAELWRLRAQIARAGVRDRVTLTGAWVPQRELDALLGGARAVLCPAYDEDYGLVALEAAGAHRAAITCTDSGALADFVVDGETGSVVEPTPHALAAAIDSIAQPGVAERLGCSAFERLEARRLSWDHVVERLLTP